MSKIIDITDKLNFEERPKFRVKGIEFEANNDAVTIIKVTAILQEESVDILAAYNLLFDKENQKIIESMKLNMNDFMALIMEVAMSVINDGEKLEGETPTPATT